MIDVEDAITQMRKKENVVQQLCYDFDEALYNMRQDLQLPANKNNWPSEFSSRLTLYNKEYRRTVKNDLQALATRLRQVYGSSKATPASNTDIRSRVSSAISAYNKAEELFDEYGSVYDSRVQENVFPLEDRIVFKRAFPRLRGGLQDAATYKQVLCDTLKKWGPYFDVLMSEDKLSEALAFLRASKITKAAFEEKATAAFDRITALCDERDAIVFELSKLSLFQETSWLARGRKGIRERTLRRELDKYNPLFARAFAQKETYKGVLGEARRIASLARTPATIPGPDGEELSLVVLRAAYAQYQSLQAACEAMEALMAPLTNTLEVNIAHMQAFGRGLIAVPK